MPLRLPSVCFGVASVWLTFALMRRIAAAPVALLAAFLAAVAPIGIMVSEQAMPYALLTALALGATLALVSAAERSTALRWAGYAALVAALAYTQYLGLLLVAAHGIWIARYHRPGLRPWGAAVLGAAVAFAPWAPSIAAQSAQIVGGQWYRTSGAALNLGDLLGLFAFGGGLFGSATYFYPGRVTLIEQAIILLPFLAAFALGLWALGGDRPARGLLLLVLAVPIGLGIAVGFFRPAFAPRWFVFLQPFWAMVVARGLAAGADLLVAERHRAVAGLTAFLLLYGGPVLSGYYGTQPAGWRSVAVAIRPLVRPGDAFVFLTPEAEMRLLYYFPGDWPAVELTPLGEIFRSDRHAALTRAQIEALAHRYPRVWVVVMAPFYPSVRAELAPALRSAFHLVAGQAFPLAFVGLYASNASPKP